MVEFNDYNLFEQDNVAKNIVIEGDGIRFTNSDIDIENFTLNESLCSENVLKIGKCESCYINFRIGYGVRSLVDEKLNVSIELEGAQEPFQIGVYTVVSDQLSADRRYRDVKAYDELYFILKKSVLSWYNQILPDVSASVTLKQFRDSFFNFVGVEQYPISLINDSAIIKRTINTDSLSGKDVLESICEMNGCFGHIDRNGKFKYIYLSKLIGHLLPSEDLYPNEDLYPSDGFGVTMVGESGTYISAKYEDFETEPITQLQIRQEENDIGVVVGSTGNDYVIEGNFLLFGMNASELTPIANNVLSKLELISYRPCEIENRGNPCIEVGDGIEVVTSYNIIVTYVLQRTLKGVQSLIDTFAATGTRIYHNNNDSIHGQIIQLRGRTNKLIRNLDETISELEAYETQTDGTLTSHNSRITQNAQSISAEVTRATGQETELAAAISVQADQIALRVRKGDVSSQLSVESGQVTISSNRLIIDSTYFKLYADGTGKLGGLSFDSIGFYSIYNNHKLFQVHPNPSDGYAMSVGLNTIDRLTDSGAIEYIKNQYGCCINSSGEMVITSLKVKDEYDASQYTMTKPGQLLVDSFIRCWGNIECGTTDSRAPLGGVGGGSIYIRRTSTDTQGTSGNLYAANNVYCVTCVQSSDRRLKKDIEELKNSEEFIYALKPVSFRYVGNDRLHHRGFIAQDIEELVEDDSALVIENTEGTKYLGYDELIADMVSTIQSQHKRISDLERRLAILEEKLNG